LEKVRRGLVYDRLFAKKHAEPRMDGFLLGIGCQL